MDVRAAVQDDGAMARKWILLLWLGLLATTAVPSTTAAESQTWMRPLEAFEKTARSLADQPEGLRYSPVKIIAADNPRFADRDWDDSRWQTIASYQDLPAQAGIYWARFRVRMDGPQPAFDDGFQVTMAASYRIFWDGVLIGTSGMPAATARQEIVGPLDGLFIIPPTGRTLGEHVVALQLSSFKNHFPEKHVRILCFAGSAAALQASMLMASAFPVIGAAALFMLALCSWILWFLGLRSAGLGWFAAICTFAAIFQTVLAARFITGYPYTWAYPMILIRGGAMGGMGLSLVMFVSSRFAPQVRRWIALGLLVVFVGLIVANSSEPAHYGAIILSAASMVALALAIATALRRRVWTDWLIVGGVGLICVLIVLDPRAYSSPEFFPRFLPTELCLMGVLGVQVRNERQRVRDVQLRSARLEIELLKKNLQPHFLFNTLTAVSEVIEQSPSAAAALIDDLAEEFRALIRLSGEKLIPISQELSLCNTHLRVVSRRMGIPSTLLTAGCTEEWMIPPAIFLTLIENAFSHQAVAGSDGIFRLSAEGTAKHAQFTFFSPGEIAAQPDRGPGGTGLRYIRARLEESFPGAWSFVDQAVPGGWESRIEIRVA